MKKFVIFAGLTIISALILGFSIQNNNSSTPPAEESTEINWMTFQELNELAQSGKWQKSKKKVFIDLYTHWCGWCKRMDASTFKDPAVVKYMNENYYAIKFNAETKESIQFGDREYIWVAGGRNGINQLGQALGVVNGRIGYPTVVFLDENLAKIQALPGYKDTKGIIPMLVFYAEDHYKTTPWNQFQQSFNLEEHLN